MVSLDGGTLFDKFPPKCISSPQLCLSSLFFITGGITPPKRHQHDVAVILWAAQISQEPQAPDGAALHPIFVNPLEVYYPREENPLCIRSTQIGTYNLKDVRIAAKTVVETRSVDKLYSPTVDGGLDFFNILGAYLDLLAKFSCLMHSAVSGIWVRTTIQVMPNY
jgi:hypothetical protein